MPWEVRKMDGKFCVVAKDTEEVVKCHPTEERAQKQVDAMYAEYEAGGGDASQKQSSAQVYGG